MNSSGEIRWFQTYSGEDLGWAGSIVELEDGSLVVTGGVGVYGQNDANPFLMNVVGEGDVSWLQIYSYGGNQLGQQVLDTGDGFLVISDESVESTIFNALVLKTDQSGQLVWDKRLGEAGVSLMRRAVVNDLGQFVLAGGTNTINEGQGDCWLVALDSDGSVLWEKTYGDVPNERATTLLQLSDGGYILAGTAIRGGEDSHGFILKTDENGMLLERE